MLRTATTKLLILSLALAFVHCGDSAEGPTGMDRIRKNKFVKIATDAVNLPFEFGAGTGVQGFDVDIGEEIGKDLGHEVKWIKMPFERLFDLLKNGEAELVISAISITPERKAELAFSEPYFNSGNTIARRKDRPEIRDLANLAGKKVGVQNLSTGHKFIESQSIASDVTIVKFRTLDDALGALNRMEVDAVVGDEPIMTYSIYKSFPNLMTSGKRLTEEQYGVVVNREDQDLLQAVNDTLARLKKSGELDTLRSKWFQNVIEEMARQREEMERQESLKEDPKSVTIHFIKSAGFNFKMDRLDGHTAVLAGAKGYFTSQPILTEGSRGSARFSTPVPPGDYSLRMAIFSMTSPVSIPKTSARSVSIDMTISNPPTIVVR